MIKETLSTSEKEIPKINLGLEEKYKQDSCPDQQYNYCLLSWQE